MERGANQVFLEVKETLTAGEERFERWRRTVSFFLGPILFLIFLLLPIPGISPSAHRLSAVLALVLMYWMGEAIPIPATALLGASLCVLLGVAPAKEVLAPFADPIVFLFIGSFLLAEAMRVHGLDRRFAYTILSLKGIGQSPVRLFFTFGAIAAFISMWISNTATTAMMFPIGLGIIRAMSSTSSRFEGEESAGVKNVPTQKGKGVREREFATGMMLLLAYSASVGGIGTPVGTPPNLIGIGMLEKLLNFRITFFQWMLMAIPLLMVMYLLLFVLLVRLHPFQARTGGEFALASDWIREQMKALGKWKTGERNCLIAFLVAVVLWVFPGFIAIASGAESSFYQWYSSVLPEGVVAILAGSLLFILPTNWKERKFTLTWSQAVRIDWGTILLFGGGLSLGGLMFQTRLAEAIGQGLLHLTGASTLWSITGAAIAMGIVISETTSNTASANMVIPVVIAIAKAAGVSGVPPALGACLGASYGFMLPVSTPPNAIVYGSGLVPITKMIRAGFLFDLLGFFIIWLGLRILCPLFGWV